MEIEPVFPLRTYLEQTKLNIHRRNLQVLATKIYKVKNDLSPDMNDIFNFAERPHNLRNNSTLKRRFNRSVYLGADTISSVAPNT